MTCSSSRTWAYMSVNIPCSPGNSKGGAGWRNCHSWFCAVLQIRHAKFIFHVISWPIGPVGKSRSSLSASGYQPGPLVSRCCCKVAIVGGYCPTCLEHHTSSSSGESHSRPPDAKLLAPNIDMSGHTVGRAWTPAYHSSNDRSLGRKTESCNFSALVMAQGDP